MIFYEIHLLSVPEILFAASVESVKYKNFFDNIENFMEFALCEEGQAVYDHKDGTSEIVSPGMLTPIFSDINCVISAFNNQKQRHTTVGVNVKYTLKKHDSDSCNIEELKKQLDPYTLLIPYHADVGDKYDDILNIIKKISVFNMNGSCAHKLNAVSKWFSLASLLTDFVLKKVAASSSNSSPAETVYVIKACEFIHMNYQKKITVSDIAEFVGVSEGYLHRMFRKNKGTGILEYINQHRVAVAIELISNKHISLKEAAYNVGIDDPAYMSRLFRKITGMSFNEYFANRPSIYESKRM